MEVTNRRKQNEL